MGTPEFAIPSFHKIMSSHHSVVGVVTQPDKPRGRGKKLLPTPIKKVALDEGIDPILQPVKLSDPEFLHQLRTVDPDVFVVVAFRILPEIVLGIPEITSINLHPSLLPKYRGAAPINWTLINGEKETGVTIIEITRKVDAGKILMQQKVKISAEETAGSLHDRLSRVGAEMLVMVLDQIEQDRLQKVDQDDRLATPAPKLTRELCHLSFRQPADKVKNRIHGLSPYPGAFAFLNTQMIKFYRARVVDLTDESVPPGTIISAEGGQLVVACQPGQVEILELQLQGKRVLTAAEFLRGRHLKAGDQFS
ncbi:methionyl-tRNA formyltransferase [candidate division KSB1 bacterium 4484_188]|nr:MAG: methionyl-tRNA formyltransferase [candidate division KSB1 bacterium 4484_188]